jgi:pyridoxine 4-dehydrogenase
LICSHAKRTIENTSATDIELTEAEKAEVWKLIDEFEVKGDRYYGSDAGAHLWG